MSRRRALRFCLVAALLAAATVGAIAWWTRARIIHAGTAVVLVEGRDLHLGPRAIAGVGVHGTLGLVGGRCVGLLDETGDGVAVIVWPPGTEVAGSGSSLSITSGGVTVSLGEELDGGSEQRTSFPDLAGRLPEECEGVPLEDLQLGG